MKFMFKIFCLLSVCLLFSSCMLPEETEAERARRMERRRNHAERQRRNNISHLSGLSDMELEAIQESRREGSTSSKSSFIYSDGDIAPDTRHYLDGLNEYDQESVKSRHKNSQEGRRTSSDFVFGL